MMVLTKAINRVWRRPTDQERVLKVLWKAGLSPLRESEISRSLAMKPEQLLKTLQILLRLGLVSRQQRPGSWGLTVRGHSIAGRGRSR